MANQIQRSRVLDNRHPGLSKFEVTSRQFVAGFVYGGCLTSIRWPQNLRQKIKNIIQWKEGDKEEGGRMKGRSTSNRRIFIKRL